MPRQRFLASSLLAVTRGSGRRWARGRGACCVLLIAGCAGIEPRAVSPDLTEPVFEPGWLLRGSLSVEPGLCTLATVGLDVTVLPSELPLPGQTRLLDEACRGPAPPLGSASTGTPGEWVRLEGATAWAPDPLRVETRLTDVLAVLHRVPRPRGIAVLFAGLAMPADAEVMRRLADALARREWIAAVVLRDDSISGFDPRWEAHRGLALARELQRSCTPGAAPPLAFLGLSMGGLEALLAARDAPVTLGRDARAAVLDPVLDFARVARNLDGSFHDVSTDAVQTYFQRIMAGRYRVAPVRFAEILERVPPGGRLTSLERDAPARWLCDGPVDRFTVLLSRMDPVLGNAQREALEQRGFPFQRTAAAGHIPFACDLSLFGRLVAAATEAPAVGGSCGGERRPRD